MTVNSASCVSLSGPGAPLPSGGSSLIHLPEAMQAKIFTFLSVEEALPATRVSRAFRNSISCNRMGPGDEVRSVLVKRALAEYRSSEPVLKKDEPTALSRIGAKITPLVEWLRDIQVLSSVEQIEYENRRVAIERWIKYYEWQAARTQSWNRFSESALDLIGDYLAPEIEGNLVYTHQLSDPLTAIGTDVWNWVIGKAPKKLFSPEIRALLQEPCPITPGRTVGETHLPVMIPSQVDGSPYTLNRLIERARNPINGNKSSQIELVSISSSLEEGLGNVPIPPGEYLLFIRPLPGTTFKTYREKLLVFEQFKRANPAYRVARLIEVLIPMIITYALSGQSEIQLFFNDPVQTSNPNLTSDDSYRVAVGGRQKWPSVLGYFGDFFSDERGLAVVRHLGSSLEPGSA